MKQLYYKHKIFMYKQVVNNTVSSEIFFFLKDHYDGIKAPVIKSTESKSPLYWQMFRPSIFLIVFFKSDRQSSVLVETSTSFSCLIRESTKTDRFLNFFLSWRLQSANICDRLSHILSLLRVWDVVVGQSLFAVPSKGLTQARNIGFYFTAMFKNTVNITNMGYIFFETYFESLTLILHTIYI